MTVRAIYDAPPEFPATDNHPDAVRYQVGAFWVDAIGGEPTLAEVEALRHQKPDVAAVNAEKSKERARERGFEQLEKAVAAGDQSTINRTVLDLLKGE